MSGRPGRSIGFWQRGERAQTTTEFVVVFPMLLLLFFLMLEFGWLFKNYIVVTNAVREATRCTIANNCTLNGGDVGPQELLISRMNAGIIGNLKSLQTDLHFVDGDADGVPDPGEALVVCAKAGNAYITPLLVFASMAGALPPVSDGIPIAAREEMIIEFVDTTDPVWDDVDPGDGTCSAS